MRISDYGLKKTIQKEDFGFNKNGRKKME